MILYTSQSLGELEQTEGDAQTTCNYSTLCSKGQVNAYLILYILEWNAGWLDLHVFNSSIIVVAAV